MRGKCKICNNLKNDWCEMVIDSPDPDMVRDCRFFSHKTNADRYRAMSDEELARVFSSIDCPRRPDDDVCGMFDDDCNACWLDWLQLPVKDGDNDVG